jgi:hypothetical protein
MRFRFFDFILLETSGEAALIEWLTLEIAPRGFVEAD